MARRISRKELVKQDDLVETAFDVGKWLEHNWRVLAAGGALVAVVVLAVLGYMGYDRSRKEKAERLLAEGLSTYRQAEGGGFTDHAGLQKALGNFEQVAGMDASSAPGLTARLYQGAALFRLGQAAEAVPVLEGVTGAPEAPATLVGAAQSLLADALVAAGQGDRAVELLQGLAQRSDSPLPQDQVLLQLAGILRARGDAEGARAALQRILDEFPQSAAAADARRRMAS